MSLLSLALFFPCHFSNKIKKKKKIEDDGPVLFASKETGCRIVLRQFTLALTRVKASPEVARRSQEGLELRGGAEQAGKQRPRGRSE